jgi:hypothetical protein
MKISKNMFKSVISLCLSFFMCFGLLTNTYAATENINTAPTVIVNTDMETKVRVESENVMYDVTLNKNTNEMTVDVIETSNIELESKSYDLNLTSIETGNISGELCDSVTGEIIELKESNTQSQHRRQKRSVMNPEIIFESLPKLAEAIRALAIAAGIITVTGVTWYVGTHIKELTKKHPDYQYFQAAIVGGYVAVTNPVTLSEAKGFALIAQYAPNSKDLGVYCTNRANSLALAKALGNAMRKVEIGGPWPQYLYHYHGEDAPPIHLWFPEKVSF